MKLGEYPDTTLRIQWSSVIRNQLSLKWRRRPPTGVVTLSGSTGNCGKIVVSGTA